MAGAGQLPIGRVLDELARVRTSAEPDAVHDLRVAIRRCRSVASIMAEVDGNRAWDAVRRLPRPLFRALGDLRDSQVLVSWLARLTSADDPLGARLVARLEERQVVARERVARAVAEFDRRRWRAVGRTAASRMRAVPPNSLAAQGLVLERFDAFRRLHARAMRTEGPATWHALRIALKRFRYAVEAFLPARSALWQPQLGEIQGVLGDIHDLDVLTALLAREAGRSDATQARSLRHAIAAQRGAGVERYRQRMRGEKGLLEAWATGLPPRAAIDSATTARFEATARAMDPHPRRTAATARLSVLLFDGLAASGAEPRCRDARLRRMLRAAATLHGIDVDGRTTPRHKAAERFLKAVLAPLGWSANEWGVVAQAVRYHRGAEPAASQAAFGRLPAGGQDQVRGLAGVLRLARGLRRCGVRPSGVRIDRTAESIRLRVSGIRWTARAAARLEKAKLLLEAFLRRPMLVELPAARRRSVRSGRALVRAVRGS